MHVRAAMNDGFRPVDGFSLENVSVSLGGDEYGPPHPVLEQVTFGVTRGSVVGLFGPSGIGKSTILNAIAGLVEVSAGTIERCDRNGRATATTAYATQRPTLLPWYSLRENFSIVIGNDPTVQAVQLAKVQSWCETMGLTSRLDDRPRRLSGGMQQRANLIRALICPSPVLLLDEPMSGTEHGSRQSYLAAIRACVVDEKRACLLVSHDREDLAIADSVVVLGSNPSTVVAIASHAQWRNGLSTTWSPPEPMNPSAAPSVRAQ